MRTQLLVGIMEYCDGIAEIDSGKAAGGSKMRLPAFIALVHVEKDLQLRTRNALLLDEDSPHLR